MVKPKISIKNPPWVRRAEFFDAFPSVDLALLERGWNLAYYKVSDMFGCPEAIDAMKDFHDYIIDHFNLRRKPVIFGFSRGGLYAFNCLWTDMEHVPNDYTSIEKQILAAKAYDVDITVRVARGGYSDYIRPLEMDASGIMVPHIMGLEDAKNVVRMTRFHPIGLRPVDGGNADGAYCEVDFHEYILQANRERFLVV